MTNGPQNQGHPDTAQILKTDLFGQISKELRELNGVLTPVIVRNIRPARWWLRLLARRLANREAKVLQQLPQRAGLPALLEWDGNTLCRTYVDGLPMQNGQPREPHYFKTAKRLLHELHRNGIVHNDTAKEPNWLVLPDGSAGLVDFQLAGLFARRSKTFRVLALEDLRHLLKHKRSYLPDRLTTREQRILAHPAWHARIWRKTGKKFYLLITRRMLNWQDREGAGDRSL
ncbi:MAG: serine/threonine protein kinase [Gammaproteobacteria bacterium]|nr:serine/threonine protein kinase [Gammaproteobacteria bacterium]